MKKLLLLILLCTSLFANAADKVWCMVTNDGKNVAMSQISYLLAADQTEGFSIVCNNGEVLYKVSQVSFAQAEPTGIGSLIAEDKDEPAVMVASSSLRIMGVAGSEELMIYDAAGRTVMRYAITSRDETVSINALSAGLYILKVGKTSVKFLKK